MIRTSRPVAVAFRVAVDAARVACGDDDVRDVAEFRELLREVKLLDVSDRIARPATTSVSPSGRRTVARR